MRDFQKTQMGGANEAFVTTCWTQILSARAGGPAFDAAFATVVRQYWKPVYCCLRRKGHGNEDAKDLTQAFLVDVVHGRHLLEQADRSRGRFRTFLLTALDRFVTDAHRIQSARKRMPAGGLAALDAGESAADLEPHHGATPEAAFNYSWAKALVDRVLAELESEYRGENRQAYWQLFQARVVRPILEGIAPPPLEELCTCLSIESAARASNMLVTAKRRFQAILRQHVRDSVASDDQVDDEIAALMRALSGGAGA